jgi:nucleotide-binding universal stress UspA family protein
VSENASTTALRQAAGMACSLGTALHVVLSGQISPAELKKKLREWMSQECRDALTLHFDSSLRDEPNLVEALRRYVDENDIDLVVADTPSDRGPIPPLSAPTIRSMLEGFDCSVFAVERRADLASLHRILIPTDLSASTRTALRYATMLVETYDASIDLLHVIDGGPYVALTPVDRLSLGDTSFPERRARRQLASLLDSLALEGSTVTHFAYGNPSDQIVHFVNEHPVDLMILPSSRNCTPSHSPLGPVADRVLRRVTCPTLVVRPPSGTSSAENL